MGPNAKNRPIDGDVLPPEPEPRIHVTITAHRRRQHSAPPAWVVVLLMIAVVMWMAPLGTVIAIVMLGIFVTAHPTIGIAIGVIIAALVIAAVRERLAGREF